jgi:RNA polymerase sigma factor (sigma-70 family)
LTWDEGEGADRSNRRGEHRDDSTPSGVDVDERAPEPREPEAASVDPDEWESNQAIYARFSAPLARFLTNKAPPGERDEVLQDTFLRFMEKRAKGQLLDKQGRRFESPGPLLFGIARMLLLELLRKLAKADSVEDILDRPLADFAPGLHTLISHEEKRSIVHECLREIPFHQQMVLECHYMQKMSYQELTQFLGVPIGTVASWCRRGRKSLKARLEKAHEGKKLAVEIFDGDAELGARREALAAYSWYDPTSGAIDHGELVKVVTRSERKAARLPEWFLALEIPASLPEATATELYEIARAVWDASV